MIITEIFFWVILFFIFYSYLVYPLILWVISKLIVYPKKHQTSTTNFPSVTLLVAAYNEEDFVEEKVQNSLALNYPSNKLKFIWVTDGSNDGSNELLKKHQELTVLFKPERNGKIHAMNRAMQFVNTDIAVFSDGNTLLAKDTLLEIVRAFENENVGCVAGEKRIIKSTKEDAAAAGEGLYWKYESWVKQLDATIGSCVGAVGELFAIRTHLFFNVPNDTILDDFVISLTIAMQGYKIAYASKAYALEKASANIHEEMKRKVRIAAGSFQVLNRMSALLNFFKYGKLSWQFISHKVFRWIIIPLGLAFLIPINGVLLFYPGKELFYLFLGLFQLAFYTLVAIGYFFRNNKLRLGFVFIPYYFFMANLAMWKGFVRYIQKKQTVQWERAKRA